MKRSDIKKILILIIAITLIGSGVLLQAKEPTQSESSDVNLKQFNLREIYYKSPLELYKSKQHPKQSEDCSVVFVRCDEVNG